MENLENIEKLLNQKEIQDFRSELADKIEEVVNGPNFMRTSEWIVNLSADVRSGGRIPRGYMQDLFWGLADRKRYLLKASILEQLKKEFLEG